MSIGNWKTAWQRPDSSTFFHSAIRKPAWLLLAVGAAATLAAVSRPASSATPQAASPPTVLARADAVLAEMSQITGLPIRTPLKKHVIGRAEIRKYLGESLRAEYTPADLHAEEVALKAFGFVPRDFELEGFLLTFYTEQAAGFFDPRTKTMYLADWVDEQMLEMVLSHELTHALQDQSFDLEKFLHAQHGNDDSTNARQAVAEGYATAAMMQKAVEPADLAEMPALGALMQQVALEQTKNFPAFSSAPYFFRFQALFPYAQGVSFIQRGLKGGGWKNLNSLFQHPPQTTREIFHPELYFETANGKRSQATAPAEMKFAPHNPLEQEPDLHLVDENTLGELGYFSLLGQMLSEDEAKRVAPGLLTDRYRVYERPGGRYTLFSRTRWSSPEAAGVFFRDYRDVLNRKFPDLTPDRSSSPDAFLASNGAEKIVLLRKDDQCLWAEGVPSAQFAALIGYLRSF